MKAIKYLALVAVALAMPLTFTSCDDDDDDDYVGGFYDPMYLVDTVWRVNGCNDNEYNFNGAKFHFGEGNGYIDDLEFGNWDKGGSNFNFSEGDGGYIEIIFDGDDAIVGNLDFVTNDYATFIYHWVDEDMEFHMDLSCIAE